MLERNQLTD